MILYMMFVLKFKIEVVCFENSRKAIFTFKKNVFGDLKQKRC